MMRTRGELLARLRIRTCQNRVHDGRDSQDNDLRCAPKRRDEPEQSMAPQGAKMHAIMKIWHLAHDVHPRWAGQAYGCLGA